MKRSRKHQPSLALTKACYHHSGFARNLLTVVLEAWPLRSRTNIVLLYRSSTHQVILEQSNYTSIIS